MPKGSYASSVETEFLDGWYEGMLAPPLEDVLLCMVSTDMLREKGLALGDTILVTCLPEDETVELPLRVAGSFVRQGSKDNIYCALGVCFDPEWFTIGQENPHFCSSAAAPLIQRPLPCRRTAPISRRWGRCSSRGAQPDECGSCFRF